MVKIFFADSDAIGAKLIKLGTWSNISHTGFLLPDNTVIDSRFGNGGVTHYSFEELCQHYPRVMVYEVDAVPDLAYDFARKQLGKKYDWTAICGFITHRNWQEDDAWFCSELVAYSCNQTGYQIISDEAWRVTPKALMSSLTNINSRLVYSQGF